MYSCYCNSSNFCFGITHLYPHFSTYYHSTYDMYTMVPDNNTSWLDSCYVTKYPDTWSTTKNVLPLLVTCGNSCLLV